MKNSVISFVLAFFMLVATAHALGEVSINDTIRVSGTNKEFYDTAAKIVPADSTSFTLQNNLNSSLNLRFSNTELNLDNDNQINITNVDLSVGSLGTTTFSIRPQSIKDVESGEYTGTINVINAANSAVLQTMNVKVLIPAVEISSIEVKDAGSDSTDTKLEKGQKFTVTVKYKNIAEQTDLENMNVKVGVYNGKDKLTELVQDINGDDLESDDDVSDLGNGKTDEVSFDFEMPFDMDDNQDFTVLAEITADAQDTSASFYARDTKNIEGSVPDDKIAITKLTATPSQLTCDVNKARIGITVQNIGDRKEDIQLFLRNEETSFEKQLNGGDDMQLGDDFSNEDDFTQSLSETVTLTDIKPGKSNTYKLVAYYNDGDSSVEQDLPISQLSCGATTSTPTQTTTPTTVDTTPVVVVTQPTTTNNNPLTNTPANNVPYVTLKDVSGFSFNSDLIVPVVIGVGGLLVGAIVVMLLLPRP